MLTKILAQRIDNGWVMTETGKEADGSTYKKTRSFKDEKAVLHAFTHALEVSQTRLDEEKTDQD
jgi:hypothetical protein